MTFGVIAKDEPMMGQLIALAFQAVGHDCLVLRDAAHAARILRTIRLDSIVVDVRMPDLNGVDWLETVVATWPDLPSRTLLLTDTVLAPDEILRVEKLGAEVLFKPLSIESVRLLVLERLQKAGSGSFPASLRGREHGDPVPLLN